jgi:anti-sigma factor RsiW
VTCDGIGDLLHGYLDGELDAARRTAVEEHLLVCAECARELETQKALAAAVRDDALRHRPPAHLPARIDAALRSADAKAGVLRRRRLAWLAAAVLLVGVGLAVWGLWPGRRAAAEEDRIAQELTASHARALMPGNLKGTPPEGVPPDQHEVKPWFQDKLDFSPNVKDWKEKGFELAGGRLDLLGDRRVAAVVYTRRKHIINLFEWPAPDEQVTPVRELSRRGYNICHWTAGGLTFWAVSDLNADDLAEFARLVRDAAP